MGQKGTASWALELPLQNWDNIIEPVSSDAIKYFTYIIVNKLKLAKIPSACPLPNHPRGVYILTKSVVDHFSFHFQAQLLRGWLMDHQHVVETLNVISLLSSLDWTCGFYTS